MRCYVLILLNTYVHFTCYDLTYVKHLLEDATKTRNAHAHLRGGTSRDNCCSYSTTRGLRSEPSRGTSENNGCPYWHFLNYKPPKFDGTGGAIAFVKWIESMDSIFRMSGCTPEQQVLYVTELFQDGTRLWWNL